MDKKGEDCKDSKKSPKIKPLVVEEVEKDEINVGEERENDETEALLPPRRGGLSKNLGKPKRSVRWNDRDGNKLAEVLEFQPSDASESDDEDSDSCLCVIM